MGYRSIHSSIAESESLSALSRAAEACFWRLLANSDSYGRLSALPGKIRARCMPLVRCTNEQVERWVAELEKAGRVERYDVAGRRYLQIVDHDAWQPSDFLRKRGKGEFPGPKSALRAEHSAPRAAQSVVDPTSRKGSDVSGPSVPRNGPTLRKGSNDRARENGSHDPGARNGRVEIENLSQNLLASVEEQAE